MSISAWFIAASSRRRRRSPLAEHDLVSEVYHVIDGSATLVTGPDIVDLKPRAADDRAVGC